MSDIQQLSLATRCLWSLQEASPMIDGLLLTDVSGLAITSTLSDPDSIQRLAALSAATFLLGEYATETWERGQTTEVLLGLNIATDNGLDAWYISLRPVTSHTVLTISFKDTDHNQLLSTNIQLAISYLNAVLTGQDKLPLLRWHTR